MNPHSGQVHKHGRMLRQCQQQESRNHRHNPVRNAKNLEMSVGNAGVVKVLVFRVFEQSFGQQDRVRQTEGRR